MEILQNTSKTVLALCVAAFAMQAQADVVYYETQFRTGIPQEFTVIDGDENPTKAGLRNIAFTGGSWVASVIDSRTDTAAVSSSYSTYDYAVDDWLITPKVHIDAPGAVLRWSAKSVHHDYRDGYSVMVSTSSTMPDDFVTIFTITEEDYYWRTRALSLDAYVGTDVYVAFVHNSTGRFMLAIDNIVIGNLDEPSYNAIDNTLITAQGGDNVTISGHIYNLAASHTIAPVCLADGVLYTSDAAAYACPPGDAVSYHFSVPAPAQGIVRYSVGVPHGNDTTWVVTDSIFCSAFARRLLVEEYTARWCTGCPAGIMQLNSYINRFGDAIVPVAAHSNYNDVMGNDDYSNGMNYWLSNMPSFLYDRVGSLKSQEAREDGNIYKAFAREVVAQVEMEPAVLTAGDMLQVKPVVRVAKELDNSNDRYRLSFIIVEDGVCVDSRDYNQSNNCTLGSDREFYFLPVSIPGAIMQYNHVARGHSTAFTGLHGLLPATLVPGEEYAVQYEVELPQAVLNRENVSVAAVLIDTQTRGVLNTSALLPIDTQGAVQGLMGSSGACRFAPIQGGCIVSSATGTAIAATLYAIDGRLVATARGNSWLTLAARPGIYIVKVTDVQGNVLNIKKINIH